MGDRHEVDALRGLLGGREGHQREHLPDAPEAPDVQDQKPHNKASKGPGGVCGHGAEKRNGKIRRHRPT